MVKTRLETKEDVEKFLDKTIDELKMSTLPTEASVRSFCMCLRDMMRN